MNLLTVLFIKNQILKGECCIKVRLIFQMKLETDENDIFSISNKIQYFIGPDFAMSSNKSQEKLFKTIGIEYET